MTPEQVIPLSRIFVEVLPPEKVSNNGLVVFEQTSREAANVAIVKALPLDYNENSRLSVGSKVIFNKHSGSVMKFDFLDKNAPEYRLLKEEDIFALVNELHS